MDSNAGCNYRVLNIHGVYTILEVYYGHDGTIVGYLDAEPMGTSLEDIQLDLAMMLLAFEKPVLEEKDLSGNYDNNTQS